MKKILTITLAFFLIIIISVSFVSAYKRLCLTYGQSIPSDENPRYTCWHDSCQICVTDNNYPGVNPRHCNKIKGCELLGETIVDEDPPELTINSPVNDFIYNSRKVLFDIESNEPCSMYYLDNINGRGRWKRICSNCQSYSRTRSFKDGLNNITIKARDRNGNFVEYQRYFYVDSKKPKIRRTSPRKGFVNTAFEVQFSEENPVSLILYYGNVLSGYEEAELNVDIESIETDCYINKKRYYCSVDVELDDYDGQNIKYWFELEDIAGSTATSRPISLSVDTVAPVIINNPDSFWTQGEGKKNKYIYFNIDITEENFDEVSYIDWNDRRPRWRRLCSRLKNGICKKKKSFRKGEHVVDIMISDEAGNAVSERVEFGVE